jgi:hypothetical protein
MKALIKYTNLNACSITLPITELVEMINGTTPTAKICDGDTCINKNIMSKGMMLAGIARRRQFKSKSLTYNYMAYNN